MEDLFIFDECFLLNLGGSTTLFIVRLGIPKGSHLEPQMIQTRFDSDMRSCVGRKLCLKALKADIFSMQVSLMKLKRCSFFQNRCSLTTEVVRGSRCFLQTLLVSVLIHMILT